MGKTSAANSAGNADDSKTLNYRRNLRNLRIQYHLSPMNVQTGIPMYSRLCAILDQDRVNLFNHLLNRLPH